MRTLAHPLPTSLWQPPLTMLPDARDPAARATFKALLNCYMREVSPGVVVPCDHGAPMQIDFELTSSFTRLRVELIYWSLTGPHDFGALQLYDLAGQVWRKATIGELIPMLVTDCFARMSVATDDKMLELLRRVLNSYDQISKTSNDAANPEANFLSAEQGLHFGHWLHPTPKSREGMTDLHQQAYGPEFGARFQLHYFAAHDSIVKTGSADERGLHEILQDIPELDLDVLHPDETLIPMHPLQADALRLRPLVKGLIKDGLLRDLGTAGDLFTATSSVRTVYARHCPWMLKFSLPVQITNSHRVNLCHELEAGVVMARLLDKLGPLPPNFQIINDPAYVTLSLPDQRETGFEVILRNNPFMDDDGEGVVNMAALTADPLPGQQSMLARIVMGLSRRQNALPSKTAKHWFTAYLDCALTPALALYDRDGIALEAHQQNSLLDVSAGLPSCHYFRDNQGYYIAESRLDALAALEPSLRDIDALCFPEAEINERFCYYLIVNQIFSVISRLGRDGFADESALVAQLRQCLQDAAAISTGPAVSFIDFLLNTPKLSAKANLLTRVHDVDELQAEDEKAVYVRLPNPLVQGV
ncbi:MAG: IucA/IucC family protein [Litoreibacter sp.]|uniref:IucA/IucC family protein n=1 Tax=Litoreibacter sp. TaxID=1969459 RepID=UPI00329A662F